MAKIQTKACTVYANGEVGARIFTVALVPCGTSAVAGVPSIASASAVVAGVVPGMSAVAAVPAIANTLHPFC